MSNFHETCVLDSMRVHDGKILRCLVYREDGAVVESELDLDWGIGNNDGHFAWGGSNFSHSAEEIRLDARNGQPILRAYLRQLDEGLVNRYLYLCERIANLDGQLSFVLCGRRICDTTGAE